MGKKYFDLYDQVVHPLNLWAAYRSAARGKRYRPAAAAFEYDLEKNLVETGVRSENIQLIRNLSWQISSDNLWVATTSSSS